MENKTMLYSMEETGRIYSKEVRQILREWEEDQGDMEKLELALEILTKLEFLINNQPNPNQMELF